MGFASSRLHAGVLRRALLVTAAASTCAAVAPAAAFAAPILEAEKMTLPSNGRIVTDAGASGGAALRYPSNGTASKTVTVPATNAIVVRARGNQCGGAPRIVVKVSGTTVLDKLVSATTWTEYKVAKSYSASSRTVTAAYTNDYRSSTCDRGVEIDSIDFVGATTTAPAPTPPLTGTAPAPTPTPTPTPTAPAPTPTAPAPTPTPTAPAPAPTGKIIKNLDFQTGDRNQWDSLQASPNRFSIVSGSTNPIPGYQYAARFFVKAGDPSVTPNSSDPRNELLWGGSSNLVFKEGDDRYFGFAAYFPNGTDGFGPNYPVPGTSTSGTDPIGHNSIIQWKQPGTGGPPIDFMIMNDAYKLGYSKPEIFRPFKRGVNRYVIRVVFSTSSTKGLVEVWHQGPGEVAMTKKSSTRIATIKSGTAGGYFKHGIYNSNRETKDAVFYSAGMKVGTTYDIVAPR